MTRLRSPVRRPPNRISESDYTTQEIVMLHLCRFTGQGDCACWKAGRRPSCSSLENVAAKIVSDVRLFDGRRAAARDQAMKERCT